MIKDKNSDTIKQIIFFLILFSGVIVCTLSPSGFFASESINPAEEEIATFDEEGSTAAVHEHEVLATFDENEEPASGSEATTDVSSLLHAEHYRSPVYFPERQKRFLISQTWMRILPFAALALLAFATTRFFKKLGRSEKIGIGAGILLLITIMAGTADAQISYPVKDAVVTFLGEGREIYQKDFELTTDVKKILKEKLWWEPQEKSIKYYYSKSQDGAVEAYAFVLSDILFGCGGRHKYCIKVSSEGQVEGVKILELTCYHSFSINNDRFLNRFKSLNTSNADKTRIDAVTGATISSNLTAMVVRRALLLFELVKGKINE
jgi:hypothetical protein